MKKICFFFLFVIHLLTAKADDLTASITNASYGLNDGEILLNISGGVSPYTFSWTGPDGFTSAEQNLSAIAPGEYCVTVVDTYCGAAQLCITVEEEPLVQINDIESGNINAHPNPFENTLQVSFQLQHTGGDYTISITSINGKELMKEKRTLQNGQQSIQLHTPLLSAGSYVLMITSPTGETFIKEIVHIE